MKARSTLPNGNFYVHLAVIFDVVVLICVLTLIASDITPRFGFSVKMAETDFLMDHVSGTNYIVAVTAGESPVVFINNRRLDGGLAQLPRELDRIVEDSPDEDASRLNVIFVLDKAVSRATEENLFDMVLSRNMRCSVAGEPRD